MTSGVDVDGSFIFGDFGGDDTLNRSTDFSFLFFISPPPFFSLVSPPS